MVIVLGAAHSARAQVSNDDRRFYVPRDAAVLGAGLATSAALTLIDRPIARFAQSHTIQGSPERRHLARQVTKVNETTLTAAGLLTYGVGRLTHGSATADIGLHMTEAIVLTSVTSQLIRGPLGRSRPQVTHDSNQYDFHFMKGFSSFDFRAYPSLHSATAFAAGGALVAEVNERHPDALWYAAPLIYGVASLPGLSRMYLDQHWASDVLMGGVVGVLFGSKVVRYQHAGPRDRLDRALLGGGARSWGAGDLRFGIGRRF